LPARRGGGRTRLPARRRPGAARLHPPALRGAGAHRGPGPVPHAGPPDRAVLRGGPRGAAPPPLARQHLRRARERPGDPPRPARRPHRLAGPGRAAAEPGAHRDARGSASHRRRGWEEITELALRALVARGGPLVAILWG